MRSQFLLFPAALVASAPAYAYHGMSLEQAQAALFPGANFARHDLKLDQSQIGKLYRETGFSTLNFDNTIRAWRASTGGWLFLEQGLAANAPITYVVAVDADGTVKAVEILDCLPAYDMVQQPAWLAHFVGKQYSPTANPVADIPNISGASLSCEQIMTGVRRLLAAYALYFAAQG